MPHTAARCCCCNKQQHKTPRAQQYTSLLVPYAHGKLNGKHYRATPKPETHITRQVVENEGRCGEKIGNKAPIKRLCIQAAQQPPPATRQQATQLLGGTCTSMSASCVAAAATCCSYCGKQNPPPPNESRAIRREGHRAISAQLASRVVRACMSVMYLLAAWMGPFYE